MSKYRISNIGIAGEIGYGKDTVTRMIQYAIGDSQTKRDVPLDLFLSSIENAHPQLDVEQAVADGCGVNNLKFADSLKDIVCILLNCTRADLENRRFKNQVLGKHWWKYEVNWADADQSEGYFTTFAEANQHALDLGATLSEIKTLPFIRCIKMTPRLLMQLVGTECGRRIIHPEVWVNSALSKSDADRINVFSDTRFPNEADKMDLTIRLIRRCPACGQYSYLRGSNCNTCNPPDLHESETALHRYKFDEYLDTNRSIEETYCEVQKILIKHELISCSDKIIYRR